MLCPQHNMYLWIGMDMDMKMNSKRGKHELDNKRNTKAGPKKQKQKKNKI